MYPKYFIHNNLLHRSMTRNSTNSRGLTLKVYATIKHKVTKSSYSLRPESRSESVNNGRWVLEIIWCCDANWCCCIIHFILTGPRGLTAGHIIPHVSWRSHLEQYFRDMASIMGLFPFHNSPLSSFICIQEWMKLFGHSALGNESSLWTLESDLLVVSLWLEVCNR